MGFLGANLPAYHNGASDEGPPKEPCSSQRYHLSLALLSLQVTTFNCLQKKTKWLLKRARESHSAHAQCMRMIWGRDKRYSVASIFT